PRRGRPLSLWIVRPKSGWRRRAMKTEILIVLSLCWAPLLGHSQTPAGALSVAIISPASGTFVAGTIAVSANASSESGIAEIQFKVDGLDLGLPGTVSPYAVSWNSAQSGDGPHILTALAKDKMGNMATATIPLISGNLPTAIIGGPEASAIGPT